MIARILGRPPTIRKPLVFGVVVAGLAFPAGALANPTQFILHTGSVKKSHSFKLRLYAFTTNPGYGAPNTTALYVILTRRNGHATQTVDYGFSSTKAVKLTGKKTLSSGRIKGKLAGGRGSINMTFSPSGPRSKAPGACGGLSGHKRTGVLKGSLTIKADKLGTITLRSVRATLSNASDTCNPPSPSCPTHGYILEGTHGSSYLCAAKSSASAKASEMIQVTKSGSGWGFYYTYAAANEPSSDYTVGPKLSTATVKGAGGIAGKATFKGGRSSGYSTGKLTGTLWVKMAAIGAVRPFASAKKHTIGGDQRHQ
ncbi:MAG: hypothetical protein JO321_11775 [Solirubrobacterales bacterium]|nr:hypothetical protein [Solirubrobacterales bacterium]MBV9166243.1 hypothetical protein [Solirubrobacterales bacterium]MBV9536078.1 hypothetical protein [Solirubrobacterales bacterium]